MPLLLLPQLVLLLVPRLLLVHLTLRACHSSKAGASEEACTSCRRRPPRCARCGARRAWDTAAAPAPGRQWSPTLRLAFRTPSCTLAVPSAPAVTTAASSGTIAAKRTSTSAATAPPPGARMAAAASDAGAAGSGCHKARCLKEATAATCACAGVHRAGAAAARRRSRTRASSCSWPAAGSSRSSRSCTRSPFRS